MGKDYWWTLGLGVALGAFLVIVFQPAAFAGDFIEWVAAFSGTIVAIAAVAAIWDNNLREARREEFALTAAEDARQREAYNAYVVASNEMAIIANRASLFLEQLAGMRSKEGVVKQRVRLALSCACPERQTFLPEITSALGHIGHTSANLVYLTYRIGSSQLEGRAREVSGQRDRVPNAEIEALIAEGKRTIWMATKTQIVMCMELELAAASSTAACLERLSILIDPDADLDAMAVLEQVVPESEKSEDWFEALRRGDVSFH